MGVVVVFCSLTREDGCEVGGWFVFGGYVCIDCEGMECVIDVFVALSLFVH